MNRKITALITSAAVALGLTVSGMALAAPASAHTPNVQVDCQALTVNLTSYAASQEAKYKDVKVIDTPEVQEVSHIDHQLVSAAVDAVYQDVKVIDKAAVPAQPAVTHVEYEFKQFVTGKIKTNPDRWWNPGLGWYYDGNQVTITDKAAVPAQPEVSHIEHKLVTPAQDAVYKDVKVIDVAYAAEVSHIEHQLVSDAKANHITVVQAGKTTVDTDFSTSFSETLPFENKYVANDWSVKVTAWDNTAYNVNKSGTTTPCAVPVVDAKTGATIAPTCGAATVTFTNPEAEYTDNKTGAATVWIDGKFKEAVTVAGDATVTRDYSFPEDSGDHTIVVKNAEFAGGAVLAEATVHSDCIAPQPENKVTYGDWETGKYGCGDTTVTEKRTVTDTPYKLVEGEWVLDTENASVTTETHDRKLTADEIKALNCPVVVTTPTPKPTASATPAPAAVKAATPAPTGDVLAQTGSNTQDLAPWAWGAGLVVLIGIAALTVRSIVRSRRKA